jgi:hypothetical protein
MTKEDKHKNSVKDEDGSLYNFTPRINGTMFRCSCGCNVFHKPNKEDLDLYKCNGCGTLYESE